MDTRSHVKSSFNYEGLVDAAILLSGRVDISRTHCITNEVFFSRSSRRGRLKEKVIEITDRRVREEEEKEISRIVIRVTKRSVMS